MKPTTNTMHYRRFRNGLCLIEVLMSLAIMAILLTATAVAFDAALQNYTINHELAAVSVSARNALHQMVTEIRSAYNNPDDDPPSFITVSGGGTVCTFEDAYARDVEYSYDAGTHALRVSVDGGANRYVLVEDVYPISVGEPIFAAAPPAETGFPAGTVGCVEIRFMISRDGLTRTFSQGAVPRNVLYGL